MKTEEFPEKRQANPKAIYSQQTGCSTRLENFIRFNFGNKLFSFAGVAGGSVVCESGCKAVGAIQHVDNANSFTCAAFRRATVFVTAVLAGSAAPAARKDFPRRSRLLFQHELLVFQIAVVIEADSWILARLVGFFAFVEGERNAYAGEGSHIRPSS